MSLLKKRLSGGLVLEKSNTERTKGLILDVASADNAFTLKVPAGIVGALSVDLPDTGLELQTESNTATLSNKTISGLVNTLTDIPPSALTGPIPLSLLATLTVNRALQSNASGIIEVSSVTNTELGYLSGVTSSIQTQIASKMTRIVSVDETVPRFNGITGEVQSTGVTISDTDDLVVPGNFTVYGTFVTLNVQTLDVEDQNISVNVNGDDTSAQGAGLTVVRTGAYGSIIYDSATVSKFKVGSIGAEVELADISSAQVLTNKDYNVGTASNTSRITVGKDAKTNLDSLTRKEATLMYGTDTKQLYVDDGVNLLAVGGSWTPYASELISSNGTISLSTTTGLQYRRIEGNAQAVSASLTPFGSSAPSDGTVVRLVGQDADNTVIISNYDAAKGAILNGLAELGFGDVLELQYDAVLDRWLETFRNF